MASFSPESSLYYHGSTLYPTSLSPSPIDADPKVLSLPEEGMREYIMWADCYNKISQNLLETVKIYKQMIELNPAEENEYNREIEERLRKANLNFMEWEITRRRILINWLRNC